MASMDQYQWWAVTENISETTPGDVPTIERQVMAFHTVNQILSVGRSCHWANFAYAHAPLSRCFIQA